MGGAQWGCPSTPPPPASPADPLPPDWGWGFHGGGGLLLPPNKLLSGTHTPPDFMGGIKQEGLRFVEQELENITIPNLHGKEGQFHYNISGVKVTELQLALADLRFQPHQHLAFDINNASISLRFRRQLLYWFFGGGECRVGGRLGRAGCESSALCLCRKVYEFLSTFITTGMRFLLNQQICPALNHAGLVLLNSLLYTVPVANRGGLGEAPNRSPLGDPFPVGMFFHMGSETKMPPNEAVEPVIKETERMVYVAVTEYFFDSAMFAYHQAGVLSMDITGEQVPKDLEVLLRATFFGSIVMLNPTVVDAPLLLELRVSVPPRCVIKPSGTSVSVSANLNIYLAPLEQPLVQLSSLTMEARLSAKVSLRGKALQVQMDLRRFRIYSNQSALESLALIPLQGPLKTLLQLMIMPIINERTKRGVQIPLPEGMDFTKEVVTNHAGFLIVGADLHFSKGLREVIEKYLSPAPPVGHTAPSPSPHL
uniref:Phospholipid transfer protein n=1 Tax=Sphenodon punctatus TaxID=8508 RepID=A0A8D0H512_SPHPU